MKNLMAYNEANNREIEMMVGKAMCAYANWQENLKKVWADFDQNGDDGYTSAWVRAARDKSEYEATVRCIEMFVRDSIYEIQDYVMQRATDEFELEIA